jgi:hypothetical protein
MGLEYIRSAAGKPYKKRWAKGLNRLKSPSLLDVSLSEEARVVTATLAPGCRPKPGDRYLVQLGENGKALVFDGHRQVASVANPPPSLTQALDARHCVVPAIVERVGGFGDTADLKLK